jgi:ABC-2 type transport system ATP-binding protein
LIAQVAGDVLTLELRTPDDLPATLDTLQRRFGVEARELAGKVVIECERGHELIPRLVEALPPASVRSLSMHRPTLADVFVKLTGHSLGTDTAIGA